MCSRLCKLQGKDKILSKSTFKPFFVATSNFSKPIWLASILGEMALPCDQAFELAVKRRVQLHYALIKKSEEASDGKSPVVFSYPKICNLTSRNGAVTIFPTERNFVQSSKLFSSQVVFYGHFRFTIAGPHSSYSFLVTHMS